MTQTRWIKYAKNFPLKIADHTKLMVDQRWSDIYVALPRSFAVVTFVFGKVQS